MVVYIFGNGNLSFEHFTTFYVPKLSELSIKKNIHFIICDFRGADTLSLEFLKNKTSNVSIYHIDHSPRYVPDKYKTKVSQWNIISGFTSDFERDNAAIEKCTHFLAKDFNTSKDQISSTQSNIIKCLSKGKIDLLLI